LKLTKILPKPLAKAYQEWDLNKAEAYLEYHEAMARVFRECVEEGRSELDKIVDSSIKEYQTGDAKQ